MVTKITTESMKRLLRRAVQKVFGSEDRNAGGHAAAQDTAESEQTEAEASFAYEEIGYNSTIFVAHCRFQAHCVF